MTLLTPDVTMYMNACEAQAAGDCRFVKHLRAISSSRPLVGHAESSLFSSCCQPTSVLVPRLALMILLTPKVGSQISPSTSAMPVRPSPPLSYAPSSSLFGLMTGPFFSHLTPSMDSGGNMREPLASAVWLVRGFSGAHWCHMILALGLCMHMRACWLLLWHVSRCFRCSQAANTGSGALRLPTQIQVLSGCQHRLPYSSSP